tara:strand:+ start:123 stop:476 length:354 start_codon:yes stop_codon:yes gene_type:complete
MVDFRWCRRIKRRPWKFVHGVLRSRWYLWFQKGQGRLAPVDPQALAGGVDVLFHRRFGQAQFGGDFLVGPECRQAQAFFLTRGQRGQNQSPIGMQAKGVSRFMIWTGPSGRGRSMCG